MPLQPEDYEAIRNLYGRYCLAVDTGDVDVFADCFAPDAVWEYNGLPKGVDRDHAFVGFAELQALGADIYAGTQGHVLHVFNVLTIDGDGDEARVLSSGQVIRRGQVPYPGTILTDVAEDVLVRIQGRWLFKSRSGHIDRHDSSPTPSDTLVDARDRYVDAALAAEEPSQQ